MFEWLKRKKVNPMVTDVERAVSEIDAVFIKYPTISIIETLNTFLKHVKRGYKVKANPYVKHARQIKMKGEQGYGNGNT